MRRLFASLIIAVGISTLAWAQQETEVVTAEETTATEEVVSDSVVADEAVVEVAEIAEPAEEAATETPNPALALAIIALVLAAVAFVVVLLTFVMVKNNKTRMAILHDRVDNMKADADNNNQKIDLLAKSFLEMKAPVAAAPAQTDEKKK